MPDPADDALDDSMDDAMDDLPPFVGSLDEEEEVGIDEDLDPRLSTLGEAEDVGLDDAEAGMDFDPVDLLDLGASENETWTDGNEAAGDDVGTDGLDTSGAEYGWTEGNEAGALEDWADDLGLEEHPGVGEKLLGDDAGEVGVEDVVRLGGGSDDDVDLPPLLGVLDLSDDGMETLADDLDLAGDALIDGDELSYEEEARLSGAILPPTMSPDRVVVAHLGPPGGMIYDFARIDGGWLAVGEELYRVTDAGVTPIASTGLDDVRPTSVAVGDEEGRLIAIGTRLSGVLTSTDGGATFTPQNAWRRDRREPEVAFFVRSERHPDGFRLWGRTRSGALFRSEDFGQTWSRPLLLAPVADLANDPEGGFLALSVPPGAHAQMARSEDGGHSWTMRSVDGLTRSADSEAEYYIAGCGPNVVITSDGSPRGPRLSKDSGKSWTEIPTLPAPGAAALVREGETQALYAALFFAGVDRGVVVRHAPDGSSDDALIFDVRSERDEREIDASGDAEGDNRVFAIDARAEAGYTILTVATGAGLFRVRVRHG